MPLDPSADVDIWVLVAKARSRAVPAETGPRQEPAHTELQVQTRRDHPDEVIRDAAVISVVNTSARIPEDGGDRRKNPFEAPIERLSRYPRHVERRRIDGPWRLLDI